MRWCVERSTWEITGLAPRRHLVGLQCREQLSHIPWYPAPTPKASVQLLSRECLW